MLSHYKRSVSAKKELSLKLASENPSSYGITAGLVRQSHVKTLVKTPCFPFYMITLSLFFLDSTTHFSENVVTFANVFLCSLAVLARLAFKMLVVLFPLLGLTWVFGVLTVTNAGIAFQYLFTILNSLQVRSGSAVELSSPLVLCAILSSCKPLH